MDDASTGSDEEDSDLMRTAPGTAPGAPRASAPGAGLVQLTAAEPQRPIPRQPKPSSPAPPAAAEPPEPRVSASGLPLLTAAAPEDPSKPREKPKPPEPEPPPAPAPSRPARPSNPGIVSAAAALLDGAAPSGRSSTFEQLQALEVDEAAAPVPTPLAPSAEARAELFARLPPRPAATQEPAPVSVERPGGSGLELEPSAFAPDSDRSELWQPVPPPGASPARPKTWAPPGHRKPVAPRAYVPPELPKTVSPVPPSRTRPVVLGLGFAALVAGGVVAVTHFAPQLGATPPPRPEVPAVAAQPVPEPAVVPPAPPAPPPAPGSLGFKGLPRGAKVQVDGSPLESTSAPSPLPTGTHQVKVEAKGYAPWEATVDIGAGEAKVLTVAMKKARKKR